VHPAGVVGRIGGVIAEPTVPVKSGVGVMMGAEPSPPQSRGCQPELIHPFTLAALAGATLATTPENSSAKIARNEISGLKVLDLCMVSPSITRKHLTTQILF
jgi:hypothetical protein